MDRRSPPPRGALRRVYDVTPPQPEAADTDEPEWWKRVPLRVFVLRIEAMELNALERLRGELSGALSVIQAQLETRHDDDEWRARARRSLGHTSQRNAMVKAVIVTHNERRRVENDGRKTVFLADARTRLESGDVAGAVTAVLDLLEGRGK